jgi:nitrogen fixation/metabolism regulation signal transduction histidine kinase
VTLRSRFLLYLILLHVVFAGCAGWFLRDNRLWLLALEVFFVLSFVWGLYLLRRFFGPLQLIRSGTSLLRDGEFTIRFTPTGQKDMDQLIDVYNRMVNSLRETRIRNEEQEQLLQRVLAESPGGIITLDVDGNVAAINPAAEAMLGAGAEGLTGRPLADLGTRLARELSELPSNESRVLALQGRRRVRCQAATFMDRGFPRRFLLLDELTQELHRSERRAYEKLIRMMSHEVNNTSGAVQSLLQSCLVYRRHLADGDREDFARALEVAIQRTAHLDAFVRSFADVVRLPGPQLQASDPWDIGAQVGLLFRDRFNAARITWREEVEPDLSRVHCDPVQLEQVLVNVVKNAAEAIEATGEPGEIVLRGDRQGRRSFLAILDSGTGLSADALEQLFSPFYTTREKGQGIGLTMVQEILLAHGFDFALENREEGGARFTIVF